MLGEQRDQFVVHRINHVGEHVDAGAEQVLGVLDPGGVDGDAKALPVGLVDQRGVERRRHLRLGAHPRLDQRHAPGRQFPDLGAGALFGRHHVGRVPHVVGGDLAERREAPAGGEKAGRIGMIAGEDLGAHRVRQVAEIGAHRQARRDPVVGEAAHVIDDVLARVVRDRGRDALLIADVRMTVDQGRNDGLAGQIDAR
jgi:hypothetical protein